MNFEEYQEKTHVTSKRSNSNAEKRLCYGMGLSVEVGHVLEEVKSIAHHGSRINREAIAEHLGDLLWYASEMATCCELSLDAIAEGNILKLNKRFEDGRYTNTRYLGRLDKNEELLLVYEDIIDNCESCAGGRGEISSCKEKTCSMWKHRKKTPRRNLRRLTDSIEYE